MKNEKKYIPVLFKIVQLKILKPYLILQNSHKFCFSSEIYETSFFFLKSCSMSLDSICTNTMTCVLPFRFSCHVMFHIHCTKT